MTVRRRALALIAAYPVSLLLTLGVMKLATLTWLNSAAADSSECESLRVEAAGWVLTLATPVVAGLACGLVFALAARGRAALHALAFGIVLSAFSLHNIAATGSQPMGVSAVLHAVFLVVAVGCAAVGGKVASALMDPDKRP